MLISHLPDVQQLMRITIVPGPAVNKYPRAAAATVHHQAVVQVRVAGIRSIHISHPCQVPFGKQQKCSMPKHYWWPSWHKHTQTAVVGLPVKIIFLPDPAGVALSCDKQQAEQSYEAEHQADEEQLSEGRDEEPRKNLGRQAEVPRGWEQARKADPASGKKKEENQHRRSVMSQIWDGCENQDKVPQMTSYKPSHGAIRLQLQASVDVHHVSDWGRLVGLIPWLHSTLLHFHPDLLTEKKNKSV